MYLYCQPEEVAAIIPQLAEYAKEKDVIKDSYSEKLIPDAVQYSLLSVLLLKEVQKHQTTIQEQQKVIENIQAENTKLRAENAVIQSGVNTLKAEAEKITQRLDMQVKK